MSLSILIDTVGWIGAICSLTAYYWVSNNKVSGTSFKFQIINLIGGIGLLMNTIYYGAYPSAVVNVIWTGIAIFALIKYRAQQNSSTEV